MSEAVPIFLIEDDEIDRELVRRAVKKAGISNPVYMAWDGAQAFEMLSGESPQITLPQPCLILLDINMPRMNGFELLEKMRADGLMKRNIVFMLTTSPRREDMMAAYDLNAAGYIVKDNIKYLPDLLKSYFEIVEIA